MSGSRASFLALLACAALPARALDAKRPLPVHLEDDHAGTFAFLAATLDLDRPHVLVLVDAHSDATPARDREGLSEGIRRVATPEERDARLRAWRRAGAVQAFDWISPLLPAPIVQVLWVNPQGWSVPEDLPPEFRRVELDALEAHLPPDLPVAVSIDLDAFAGLTPEAQAARFQAVWDRVLRLPRLAAVSFAVSRPWLADDAEASRLVLLAVEATLALAHAELQLEPYGIAGPDRSLQAKQFYAEGREPPRFDPETASPELRSLLLANAGRVRVALDPRRWEDLLSRWRADGSEWRLALEGVEPGADGILRPDPHARPSLRVEGSTPGLVRRVVWRRWTPAAWAYDVVPELATGKVFVGAAPPVIDYQPSVLAETTDLALPAEVWIAALPGPGSSGVLRVSADVETDAGVAHTARLDIRRGIGRGFRAGLSEQFGLPYVYGAGFLRRAGLRGPDTGVGNDCANFLVHAWRRLGLRIPWSNPAQLRRHLVPLARGVRAGGRTAIPAGAIERGLVIHLGSHVAALWEDRAPFGTIGREDLVVHHLGGPPEVVTLARLLGGRRRASYDVYLGPPRAPVAWIAIGGDVMPGAAGPPPAGLRERLARADLAVANLETTAGGGGRAAEKRWVFRIPAARLGALRALGFRAFSLANNHAQDFGPEGLAGTLDALAAARLGRFGAGTDERAATAAWYAEVKGVTIAFLAASLVDAGPPPAGSRAPGVASLPAHERELAEALAEARRRARCVIVLVHWGAEGTTAITDAQRRWARWLVAHGADAVVGSGPHVRQAREAIEGAPVFYSVGNLWFEGRWPAAARTAPLAMLGLDRTGRIVSWELTER